MTPERSSNPASWSVTWGVFTRVSAAGHEERRLRRRRVGHDLHGERVGALHVGRAVEVEVERAADPRRPGDLLAARRADRLREQARRREDRRCARVEEIEVEVRACGPGQAGDQHVPGRHLDAVDHVVDRAAEPPGDHRPREGDPRDVRFGRCRRPGARMPRAEAPATIKASESSPGAASRRMSMGSRIPPVKRKEGRGNAPTLSSPVEHPGGCPT